MLEVILKIWYFIVILPFFILIEASAKLGEFLKKKNIYTYWDIFHSFVVLLIILFFILLANGYTF